MKKELTTLKEKEQFVQTFLNIDTNIENIILLERQLEVVDYEDNHMIFSSNKFMRSLNESLMVARRDSYKNCGEFIKEYQSQKRESLVRKIESEYPSYQQFIISGDEVAIFVPQETGMMIIQEQSHELIKK